MNIRLIMIPIFILTSITAFGLTLKYRQNTISNDSFHSLNISSIEDGYHLTGISDINGYTDYILNPDYSTSKWKISNINKNIYLEGERNGNIIKLKGIFKGNPVDRIIEINSNPWIEQWEIGLESFILSGENQKLFWSINPDNLNQIGEFIAIKNGDEIIDLNGAKIDTIKVKVTLTGFIGNFFHFDFNFRKSDGRLLVENYPADTRGIPTKVELIDEQ